MNKKILMNVESVYTANAFQVDGKALVAAGSETTPQVYLQDMLSGEKCLVSDCPGGVMSFVPVPGNPDVFYSIMGLFPGFVGQEAGVFQHRRNGAEWTTVKAMPLPWAHRCDVIEKNGKCYLFGVSCSKFKAEPLDWSNASEIWAVELDSDGNLLEPVLVDNNIYRNHGMLKTKVAGVDHLYISGAEGIFEIDMNAAGKWGLRQVFDKEVSEFGFVDLNGDGQEELVTIEPFHGENLNVYRKNEESWELKFTGVLSFGHGLSCGVFNGQPVIVVGNRRGTYTLDMYTCDNLAEGKFTLTVLEEEAGPTQTLVFNVEGTDYILSANQKKNEVAVYSA